MASKRKKRTQTSSNDQQILANSIEEFFQYSDRSQERTILVKKLLGLLSNSQTHWTTRTIRLWFNNNKNRYLARGEPRSPVGKIPAALDSSLVVYPPGSPAQTPGEASAPVVSQSVPSIQPIPPIEPNMGNIPHSSNIPTFPNSSTLYESPHLPLQQFSPQKSTFPPLHPPQFELIPMQQQPVRFAPISTAPPSHSNAMSQPFIPPFSNMGKANGSISPLVIGTGLLSNGMKVANIESSGNISSSLSNISQSQPIYEIMYSPICTVGLQPNSVPQMSTNFDKNIVILPLNVPAPSTFLQQIYPQSQLSNGML
ncbi:hypothetical protein TRFO_22208 [Tritrichomonas foetus]|uniref:Homeobox domain-containing protein n=1 Tax=Tritrichomonas foetus TaxID=1144522 RepID=A0A1J4KC93_9EUKA|nr:hypothetical protein TRFO_22208 [Tritrichomonas foetus]|eukprot:OHT09041.1 hypothetical protein TRFO_22208 [Tritrichomonas foetus]